MDVGAVERLLRSLAFEGLGGLEFRVPAEVDGSQNLAAPKAGLQPLRSQLIQITLAYPWDGDPQNACCVGWGTGMGLVSVSTTHLT